MELHNNQKTVYAKNGKAWRQWLQQHCEKEQSIWLIMYHQGKGKPSVYYSEAVEEALCFGWIDSKPNKRDAESYYQFFSRRKPKSGWSAVNKNRVDELLKEGRMTPAGLAVIEAAKQSGSWQALDDVEMLKLPKDLVAAFRKNRQAAANFEAFPKSVKRGILDWVRMAKREETRTKRITEIVALAAENKRAAQYIKKELRQ